MTSCKLPLSIKQMALVLGITVLSQAGPDAFAQQIDWSELDLSPQQVHYIQSLEQQWRQKYRTVHPQLSAKRQQLRQMMSNPNADSRQMLSVQQDIQDHEQALREEATRVFMEKRRVLSHDQRKALHEMMYPVSASR